MNNHASRAAHDINEMIRTAQHEPTLDGLTPAALREKLRRRPFVKHPDRSNTWVRSIFPDRDRTPAVPSSPPDPGRESFGGEAA